MIGWFELVALQEVRDNLVGLRAVQANLPKHYRALFSDTAGNNERMAFLYDSRKVSPLEEIGEIGFSPRELAAVRAAEVGEPFVSFDRTPHLAAFEAGQARFLLANVHLYYGTATELERRAAEAFAVASWAERRQGEKHTYNKNVLALGDFNLPRADPKDAIYRALVAKGLRVPKDVATRIGTNLGGRKQYDQVVFLPEAETLLRESGVVRFDEVLFHDLAPAKQRPVLRYRISTTASCGSRSRPTAPASARPPGRPSCGGRARQAGMSLIEDTRIPLSRVPGTRATREPPWKRLNLSMQRQLQDNWCWAAVSTSVAHYFGKSDWTQCSVVGKEVGDSSCCANGSSAKCNVPWRLEKALKRVKALQKKGDGMPGNLGGVRSEIDKGRPPVYPGRLERWRWPFHRARGLSRRRRRRRDRGSLVRDLRCADRRVPERAATRSGLDAYLLHHQEAKAMAMALRSVELSDSALETIRAGVARLAARPEFRDRALGGAKLDAAAPHDVYTLGLAALAEGKGLQAAEPVGRRVLLMRDAAPVAAAELDDPEGGAACRPPRARSPRPQRARSRAWSPGPPSLTATTSPRPPPAGPLLHGALAQGRRRRPRPDRPLEPAPAGIEAAGVTTQPSCSASCASGRARGSRTPTTRPAEPPTGGETGQPGPTPVRARRPAKAA